MQAIIKSNKKIIINQIDETEIALINDFVDFAITSKSLIRELYDIDNDFDGASFELINDGSKDIPFKNPGIQILTTDFLYAIDLETDDDTSIELIKIEEELNVTINGSIISIEAPFMEEYINQSKHYNIAVKLTKEEYEPVILPINIIVLYFKGESDYNNLENLPKISGITLQGNLSLDSLGIQEEMDAVTTEEIDELFN